MVHKVTSQSAQAFVPAQHFRGLPPSRKPFLPARWAFGCGLLSGSASLLSPLEQTFPLNVPLDTDIGCP